MHSIEFAIFTRTLLTPLVTCTILFVLEVLVDILRYCVTENTTNIKHCENTPTKIEFKKKRKN